MFDAEPNLNPITTAFSFHTLLYTVLFNTVIAVLLTLAGVEGSFWHTLLFSQCIGLSICACVATVWRVVKTRGAMISAVALLLALFTGAAAGTLIGSMIAGIPRQMYTLTNLLPIVGFSMLFGLMATYFFHSRHKIAESIQIIQHERLKRLSSEKQALEADLKRLQAQIEPHFLFNTLSNIVSLIDTDAPKARAMLIDLIQYLRITLSRTREKETTLGKEIELVRAYLEIFKIRMGDRLSFRIDICETLREIPLPPMLLQPVVENALLHGIDPKIEGGCITISARDDARRLKISISDTGVGMAAHQPTGLGLTNIKKRLAQIYGEEGRLIITENQPCGVTVIIEIPLILNGK